MPQFKLRRRFILSSILLVITMVLFYVVGPLTIDLSNIPPSDMLDNLFVQPDGTRCTEPCMFGVYIGKTKPADISNILRSHPYILKHFSASDFSQTYSFDTWIRATTSDLGFEFWGQDSKSYGGEIGGKSLPFQMLKTIPSQEMPTLGQFIHTLGIPAHVTFTELPQNGQFDKDYFYSVGLTYPQYLLIVSFSYLPDGQMKPDDRPASLDVLAADNNPSKFTEGGSWLGFRRIQDYLWFTEVDIPY